MGCILCSRRGLHGEDETNLVHKWPHRLGNHVLHGLHSMLQTRTPWARKTVSCSDHIFPQTKIRKKCMKIFDSGAFYWVPAACVEYRIFRILAQHIIYQLMTIKY